MAVTVVYDVINERFIPVQTYKPLTLEGIIHFLNLSQEKSTTPVVAVEVSKRERGLTIKYLAEKE